MVAWTGLSAAQHALLSHTGLPGVGGGGGGPAGQKVFVTVGTPGVTAFGGVGASPADMLASADYQGDGVNDHVAIQAAIDEVAALQANLGNAVVWLHPGLYLVNAPLDPKGVMIRAADRRMTFLYATSGTGAPANMRVFDSTGPAVLEHLTILAQTGGAAAIRCSYLHMVGCDISGDNRGTDAGIIDAKAILTANGNWGQFLYNSVTASSFPYTDPVLSISDPLNNQMVLMGNTFGGTVRFSGSNTFDVVVTRNIFNGGNLDVASTSMFQWWITENRFQSGSIVANLAGGSSYDWYVERNIIFNGNIDIDSLIVSQFKGNIISAGLFGRGMDLSNCGEIMVQGNSVDAAKTHGIALSGVNESMIVGNRVRGYSQGGVGSDGIFVVNSTGNTIQGNTCSTGVGRYGVNISDAASASNWVTNNKLNGGGNTASFHDAGTATITAAGNYL